MQTKAKIARQIWKMAIEEMKAEPEKIGNDELIRIEVDENRRYILRRDITTGHVWVRRMMKEGKIGIDEIGTLHHKVETAMKIKAEQERLKLEASRNGNDEKIDEQPAELHPDAAGDPRAGTIPRGSGDSSDAGPAPGTS